jgi:hypothetical protein
MAHEPKDDLTIEQKFFNVKKKVNELKRSVDRADKRDMQSDHVLTQRQARAILRAALAEISDLM